MLKKMVVALSFYAPLVLAGTAAQEVQTKLNSMRTMKADFQQVVTVGTREISRSSGTIALSRPGRFRWHTKKPMEQLIVADGNKLWIYDVDLEQVSVKKQEKGVGGTPALFLSGLDNTVERDFTVSKNTKASLSTYDLQAKSTKENYQKVSLGFTGPLLKTIKFNDQLGQTTLISLQNVQNNRELSKQLFQFSPPKGVDVVTE